MQHNSKKSCLPPEVLGTDPTKCRRHLRIPRGIPQPATPPLSARDAKPDRV